MKPSTRSGRHPDATDEIQVLGVSVTHPKRVLFESTGTTKRDLVEYFLAVRTWMLPEMVNRPLSIVRCPRGTHDECFFQKHLTPAMPAQLSSVEIQEQHKRSLYPMIAKAEDVIRLIQVSTVEFHTWPARRDRLDRPDRLVFDLDPGTAVTFGRVVQAAKHVRDRIREDGLVSFVRTTGSRGLHVVAPLERRGTWEQLRHYAEKVARELTAIYPHDYVASSSKRMREGKVFIDFLRNLRGATSIASYSPRARPIPSVATPVHWDELDSLPSSDCYTITSVIRRVAELERDPWSSFHAVRQSIAKRML